MSGNLLFQLFAHSASAVYCRAFMHYKRKRVHRLTVNKDIQLQQFAFAVPNQAVIKGRVAAAAGFQHVKEIIYDFIQRHFICQHRTRRIQIFHTDIIAAPLLAEFHNRADVILRQHDFRLYNRLLHLQNTRRIRHIAGVGKLKIRTVRQINLINNAGGSRYQIQIIFPFQTFLHNFQMQQAQKAAAETKAKRNRGFRLKEQRGVIQLEFFQRITQVGIFCAIRRENAAVNHRINLFIAGKGFLRRPCRLRHRIAYAGICHIFNTCRKIANHAGGKFLRGQETPGTENADLHNVKFLPCGHHFDLAAFPDTAVKYTHQYNNTAVLVINGIKNQGFQRCVRVARRRRNICNNALQNILNIYAVFCGNFRRILRRNANDILNLLLCPCRVCTGQVNFVDYRKNLKVIIQRKVNIRKRLRLNALCCVHNQNRTFACRQAAGNLIVKINMTRCVNQVIFIFLPVLCMVNQTHCLRFDGNTAFTFQIHVVQYLLLHLAVGEQSRFLYKPVRQSRFAMINMCYNTKIPYIFLSAVRHTVPPKIFTYWYIIA